MKRAHFSTKTLEVAAETVPEGQGLRCSGPWLPERYHVK
jgi:hypothetical protein